MVLLDSIRQGLHANGHRPTSRREVRIRVRGGYSPDTIRAEAGIPLRLVFIREETASCSEQVVFPAFGKSAMLPTGTPVTVELLPDEPGEYEFTCAMGILHGRLIVENPQPAERPHTRQPRAAGASRPDSMRSPMPRERSVR